MKQIFFPGCRIKAGYEKSSQKLKDYIENKGIEITGCCKENYDLLKNHKALLICNNCVNELNQLVKDYEKEYVLDLINQDQSFIFPDYKNNRMYLQVCHYGYEDHILDTVHELLDKMHIDYIDLHEEVDETMNRQEHRDVCNRNASLLKDKDVVTYCAICNLAYDKQNIHTHYLLDLLFMDA